MSKLNEYQYSYVKSIKINKHQKETLHKLKNKYNIDISQFIRIAIQEKIKKDYSVLSEKLLKSDCPF